MTFLPCPFCGCRDIAYVVGKRNMTCFGCDAIGPAGADYAEASGAWNSRFFASPYIVEASSDGLECQEPPPTYETKR